MMKFSVDVFTTSSYVVAKKVTRLAIASCGYIYYFLPQKSSHMIHECPCKTSMRTFNVITFFPFITRYHFISFHNDSPFNNCICDRILPIWVHLTPKIFNDQISNFIVQIYLLMVLSHFQYIKLQEIFSKLCPALISNPLNLKILIISRVAIWVIFQNSVTYNHFHSQEGCLVVVL